MVLAKAKEERVEEVVKVQGMDWEMRREVAAGVAGKVVETAVATVVLRADLKGEEAGEAKDRKMVEEKEVARAVAKDQQMEAESSD